MTEIQHAVGVAMVAVYDLRSVQDTLPLLKQHADAIIADLTAGGYIKGEGGVIRLDLTEDLRRKISNGEIPAPETGWVPV